MVRVLLVYEDFNELTLTETYLKKVGFDVVGISNEILIHDQILSFNPEILVVHGKNVKVSSFSVGQKLKDYGRFHGNVVIVVPRGVRPTPAEMIKMKMDAMVEAPIDPEKLIQVLCRLSGVSLEQVLDKLHKAKLSDPDLNKKMIMISGTVHDPAKISVTGGNWGGKVPLEDKVRAARYKELIKDVYIDTEKTSHHRQELKEAQKEMKKDWFSDELDNQDELKRQFVEAMFKKK